MRKLCDFNVYDGVGSCVQVVALTYENLLLNFGIVGNHEVLEDASLELANDGDIAPLEDLENLAFCSTAIFDPVDADQDGVALHGVTHETRRNEDIAIKPGRRLFRDDKAVAISVYRKLSCNNG